MPYKYMCALQSVSMSTQDPMPHVRCTEVVNATPRFACNPEGLIRTITGDPQG